MIDVADLVSEHEQARADHRNWSSAELAERIAGTVRAIAAGRLAAVGPETDG